MNHKAPVCFSLFYQCDVFVYKESGTRNTVFDLWEFGAKKGIKFIHDIQRAVVEGFCVNFTNIDITI